ncbi:MAG TPA: hypothetical protein VFS43_42310 [Polyangiaceae bacterium]|nr:hypothetical protein [Polyangiaceae bacterium]
MLRSAPISRSWFGANSPALLGVALAVSFGACGAPDDGPADAAEGADVAAVTNVGNWADQDTNGVGTHRIDGDGVNVRGDEPSQVRFVASAGEQLALTYRTKEFQGKTYYEGYFKGAPHDGERGWVAGDFLAYSALVVCNGNDVSVRTGASLETVVGTVDAGTKAFVVSGTVRNTGTNRYFEVSAGGLKGFVATAFLCRSGGGGNSAQQLLASHNSGHIRLQDYGTSSDPLSNIQDAAAGQPADMSCGGCTSVTLKPALLNALVALAQANTYVVTSIAGGIHSSTSYHYQGRAADFGTVNGVFISGDTAASRAFMQACKNLGAVEVLGPSNDVNHQDHIHCAW